MESSSREQGGIPQKSVENETKNNPSPTEQLSRAARAHEGASALRRMWRVLAGIVRKREQEAREEEREEAA